MSFDRILGQILQGGMGGSSPAHRRLNSATQNLGRGGGIDGIFGQIQDALGQTGRGAPGGSTGAAGTTGAGGFAERAKDFLRSDQVGGLSGAQVGGIGAAAGALLGGGVGGAMRGGAMAVLGSLAVGALRRAQAGGTAGAGAAREGEAAPIDDAEIRSLASPEAERLVLRAMIAAAKSDGQVDKAEMEKIVGRLGADEVTEEERQFVMRELDSPADAASIAAEARSPAQAAEVYAACLLVIDGDSAAERKYLRDLAAALKLDAATVAELHDITGAPA
jgi:uncharacterized membrane protein YebE (DUF533 family)